jgi:hypothetical protein
VLALTAAAAALTAAFTSRRRTSASLPRRRMLAAPLGAWLWLIVVTSAAVPPAAASIALTTTPASPAAVAAAKSWTILPTPSPGSSATLSGVSCLSMTNCMAIGNYVSNSGDKTLAEHWNGARWTVEATPTPAGALVVYLMSVSCSSGACTAVGHYEASSGVSKALAERWNGTKWTIQPTPGPGRPSSYFEMTGVSCPSAASCTAVTSSPVLAEHWNGTTWTIQPVPLPNEAASGTRLNAVSCSSAVACTAAGDYDTQQHPADYHTLAEHWNGIKWAIQATPNPAGNGSSFLEGVSCPPGNACTAAGGYQAPGKIATLAEHWNAATWTIQTTPNRLTPEFFAVSCASPASCTAVGSYQAAGGKIPALAEHWNGTTWTIQATPEPGSYAFMTAVSCRPPASDCIAAGYYQTLSGKIVTLAERYA